VYLWIKAFHIVFMVAWFAGLFYLPRLFVYHAGASDPVSIARFKVMERRLYRGITTPSAALTLAFGLWMVSLNGWDWLAATRWFHWKLGLVVILFAYHGYLGRLVRAFAADRNEHSEKYFRIINELPVFALVPVVILAEVKPF
jgi:putative membrane protein